MTVEALAEQALRPLDELRGAGLRALAAGGPFARAVVRRRSTRVPLLLTVHAVAAWTLAVLAPSFLLAVAPLGLAVPHLAADVRHLMLRRVWPRGWLVATLAFATALLAERVLAAADPRLALPLGAEQGLGAAWVVFAAVMGSRAARRARAVAVVAAGMGLAVLAVGWPRVSQVALVHGHNLVAVVIWLSLFRRSTRLMWLPVCIVLGGGVVLASGTMIPFTVQHGALAFGDLHLFAAADWLGPGLPDAAGVALAMSFAFLQSAHYAIWLVGVPAGDRPGEGGRSLRVAARDFIGDFRPAGALAVVLLAATVGAVGLFHPGAVRRLILSLGMFHAWLELAVLAYLFAGGSLERRPPRP